MNKYFWNWKGEEASDIFTHAKYLFLSDMCSGTILISENKIALMLCYKTDNKAMCLTSSTSHTKTGPLTQSQRVDNLVSLIEWIQWPRYLLMTLLISEKVANTVKSLSSENKLGLPDRHPKRRERRSEGVILTNCDLRDISRPQAQSGGSRRLKFSLISSLGVCFDVPVDTVLVADRAG